MSITSKAVWSSLMGCFLVAASWGWFSAPDDRQVQQEYVVQGVSADQAAKLVRDVGGEVTHELKIIKSVGAKLTESQKKALGKKTGIKRIWQDRKVATNTACQVNANSFYTYSGSKLKWTMTNNGSGIVTINEVTLAWPDDNGVLKKIKLGGDEIYKIHEAPPTATIASGWASTDVTKRQLNPGEQQDLELEFDHDPLTADTFHTIHVGFAEGCSVDSVPPPCAMVGSPTIEMHDKTLEWDIYNHGDSWALLESVSVTWPESSPRLKKVKDGGDELYNAYREPPFTTISSGWSGDWNRRSFEPGKTMELKIEFEENVSQLVSDYYVVADFNGGCSVMFDGETQQAGSYETNSGKDRDTFFPTIVGADQLQLDGIDGSGVTVALIDTGVWDKGKGLDKTRDDESRYLVYYDAIEDKIEGSKP